jgi:hypothetical protein
MSRALANLGLAVFPILTAAFLMCSLGPELHVLNATTVSEIDAQPSQGLSSCAPAGSS